MAAREGGVLRCAEWRVRRCSIGGRGDKDGNRIGPDAPSHGGRVLSHQSTPSGQRTAGSGQRATADTNLGGQCIPAVSNMMAVVVLSVDAEWTSHEKIPGWEKCCLADETSGTCRVQTGPAAVPTDCVPNTTAASLPKNWQLEAPKVPTPLATLAGLHTRRTSRADPNTEPSAQNSRTGAVQYVRPI